MFIGIQLECFQQRPAYGSETAATMLPDPIRIRVSVPIWEL